MKHFFSAIVFLMLTSSLAAQNNTTISVLNYPENVTAPLTNKETRFIIEAYGDYAKTLVFNNPARLKAYKHLLRNRVIVTQYKNKNLSGLPLISSLDKNKRQTKNLNFSTENFNPLLYDFTFFSAQKKTLNYRVDNTQFLVTLLPQH